MHTHAHTHTPLTSTTHTRTRPGHEKYFRTTAYGLTGHLPDYACLIVGANMGVVGMCKEHLGVALALKVPVFFVVTKVDIAPEHVLKNTVQVRCLGCAGGLATRVAAAVLGPMVLLTPAPPPPLPGKPPS
jgi:translation elongation factor EF-Tu-like GTPase